MPTVSPAIDTLTNKVIATIPIGQAPQAITYVPNAVPEGDGTQGLQPLGVAGQATHLALAAVPAARLPGAGDAEGEDKAPTSVSLFDQGLIQVLQASVTGLEPKQPYVLALAREPERRGTTGAAGGLHDESGRLGDRQRDRPDPAGRARRGQDRASLSGDRAKGRADKPGAVVQVQLK